ncbi:MAG: MarR family transcriptional regulator [Rubrivivax sp.]|nr:MarR family transcriptional regulator [Rubrivivax sp.]
MASASSWREFKLLRGLDEGRIGLEARVASDDHTAIKLWLRLLACSTQIEQEIRARLRQRFATTLPRFDYLAQLARHPQGLRMNALSRYLMVTGGNVTGLTDQLVGEGLVERLPDPGDRRSLIVRLTGAGQARFVEMAAEHEAWLVDLFDGFDRGVKAGLYAALGQLRLHLASKQAQGPAAASAPPVPPVGSAPAAAPPAAAKALKPVKAAKAAPRKDPPPEHPPRGPSGRASSLASGKGRRGQRH